MSGPSQSRSNSSRSGSHYSQSNVRGDSGQAHHSRYHKSERSNDNGANHSSYAGVSDNESDNETQVKKRRETESKSHSSSSSSNGSRSNGNRSGGSSTSNSNNSRVRRESLPLYRRGGEHHKEFKVGRTGREVDREDGERSRETSPGTPTNDAVHERSHLDHSLLLRKLQQERNLKSSLDRGTSASSPKVSPANSNPLGILHSSSSSRSPPLEENKKSDSSVKSLSSMDKQSSSFRSPPKFSVAAPPSITSIPSPSQRSRSLSQGSGHLSPSSSPSPRPMESSPSPPTKSLNSSRSPKPSPHSSSPSPSQRKRKSDSKSPPNDNNTASLLSRSSSRSTPRPSPPLNPSPLSKQASYSPLPSTRRSLSRSHSRSPRLNPSRSPVPALSPSVSSPQQSILDLTPPPVSSRKRGRDSSTVKREAVVDENSLPADDSVLKDSPPLEHSPLLVDSPQVVPRDEPSSPQPAIQLSDSEDEGAKPKPVDSDPEAHKQKEKEEESDVENDHLTYHLPALMGCRSVNCYRRKNKIDEGQYGVVFRAEDKTTGEIYALKKIKMYDTQGGTGGFPITSLREINILRALDHPNIVPIKEIVTGEKAENIFMVMEYMEHDMKMLMRSLTAPFSQAEVKCLIKQLLEATACMHENWILHRDLKTSNLLLNNKGILKVCDFGLARLYGSPLGDYTGLVITLWYRPPELLFGCKKYSSAVDMWSVGCIFAEFLLKDPLIAGKSELFQLTKMFNLLGTPTTKQWPGMQDLPLYKTFNLPKNCRSRLREKFPRASYHGGVYLSDMGFDLLEKMLTYDPAKRITAAEALRHPYFDEFPKAQDPSMMRTFPSLNEDGVSRANRHKLKSGVDPHVIREEMEKQQAQNGFFFRES